MKKTTFLIAGKHAVTEALKNPARKVLKVFLTEDSKKILNKDNQNLDLLKDVKLLFKTRNSFYQNFCGSIYKVNIGKSVQFIMVVVNLELTHP